MIKIEEVQPAARPRKPTRTVAQSSSSSTSSSSKCISSPHFCSLFYFSSCLLIVAPLIHSELAFVAPLNLHDISPASSSPITQLKAGATRNVTISRLEGFEIICGKSRSKGIFVSKILDTGLSTGPVSCNFNFLCLCYSRSTLL